MKEAHECLALASRCERLADTSKQMEGQRMYRQLASQWRKLADDSARHKHLIRKGQSERAEEGT